MRWGARKMIQDYFAKPGLSAASATKEIARAADLLMIEHGDEADLIAARRADHFFTIGDQSAGRRWAEIFRVLAARHLSACERFENARAVSASRF